ncbi:MAG: response regulator [Ignavibacteriae bacterium]|nr:response regulator [Ignavibacteria bacterium]MBI3363281.1 response regulator [Ignavibacteriota bacterium]
MADKLKLLVVDDEDGLRTLLKSELEFDGFDVDEADGGIIALETMKNKTYDVVILDIRMPDMDGLQVLRRLKAEKLAKKVVMLTGVDELKIAREALELGADDFLTKPIEFKNLLACIKRVVKE